MSHAPPRGHRRDRTTTTFTLPGAEADRLAILGHVNKEGGSTVPFTHADIVKVDLRWQVGSICMAANIFQCMVSQSTPHSLADFYVMQDMGLWMTDIMAPMAPHIVVSVDVKDCNVYKKVGPLWNLVGPAPVVFVAESIGDPLPSGVAALIVAYTYLSKVMGKKYFVGLSETGQTAGLWISAVLAAMLQSAAIWIAPFQSIGDPTSTYVPGVWSLKSLSFQGFAVHFGTRDVPAYQRRRKEGVGT